MPEMKNDRPVILITGSSGLLGRNTLAHFAEHADRFHTVGFDRDGNPQPPAPVECVCVDLTDDGSIELGLDRVRYAYGNHIAAVLHYAAYYNFSGEESPLYNKVTVDGSRRLMEALQPFDVERFVFSSTMLIHAPTEPGNPITEDHPIEAKWPYPQSKVETERVLHEHRGDIPLTHLRIAGVYTDGCDSIPIAHQIQRIYERQLTSRVYPGDLSHGQTFVHLDDLIRAVAACVEHRNDMPEETAILIGEPGRPPGYGDLQREIARLIHGDDDWKTRQIPPALAKSGAWLQDFADDIVPGVDEPFIKPWMIDLADDHYEIDTRRAKQMLDWTPKHALLRTLPQMIESLLADPEGWYERHGLDKPRSFDELPRAVDGATHN